MKIEEENIGRVFKDAFENYSVDPDPIVWNNVKANATKKLFYNSTAFKLTAALISTAIIITAVVLLSQNNNLDNSPQITNQSDITENDYQTIKKKTTKPQNTIPIAANEQDTISDNNGVDDNAQDKKASENIAKTHQSEQSEEIVEKDKSPALTIIEPKDLVAEITDEKFDNEEPIEANEIKKIDSRNNDNMNPDINIEKSSSEFDTSKIKFNGDSIICFGEDAKLSVSEGYRYVWNTGKTTNQITVSPVFSSNYTVEITDEYGNKIEHTFRVEVDKSCSSVLIPSAFSPDNDGINDKLEVYGKGILDYEIRIFNKQGQLLFVSKDINQYWDGTYNGKILGTGVYVYRIVYTDAKENQQIKQGTVSIVK